MKASLHTLGCRLNQAETAIIAKSLQQAGYDIVEFGQQVDITVINTCTVTEQADSKCRQAVRKTIKKNPDTFVAVVGCYAQMAVDTIKEINGVDLIVGNEHKLKILDYLDGLEKKDSPLIIHSPKIGREDFTIESHGLYDNSTRANLKIQDGCNFVCSFCIIPKARGPARSRKLDDIIKEATTLAELGHKELVITGVNIGTYQCENYNIVDVVTEVERIDNIERIRISSIEPTTIPKKLIYKIAESDKMCKHLHIPLQSGDDKILSAMRRKHTVKEFTDFVEFAHKTIPDVGIGTDVMVGFPGEGREEFVNTKKILADLPISYFHVFTYSEREGTSSVKMQDKVDYHDKKDRTRILIDQGKRKKKTYYEEFIGIEKQVLFEQRNKSGNWTGYTSNYMSVEVPSEEDLHNQIRSVKLVENRGDIIKGNLQI
jgi:threonylcarbamoyladenosine tRNA methylthiotransferase MtaB